MSSCGAASGDPHEAAPAPDDPRRGTRAGGFLLAVALAPVFALPLTGCSPKPTQKAAAGATPASAAAPYAAPHAECPGFDAERWLAATVTPRHAESFRVEPAAGGRLVTVWPGGPGSAPERVLLTACGRAAGPAPPGVLRVSVPVRRLVTTSTSHVAHLAALGAEESLLAVDVHQYVISPSVRRRIDAGLVHQVGVAGGGLNAEVLVALAPDLVLVYAAGSAGPSTEVLRAARLPLLHVADFHERTPLGQAEWLLLTGVLLDREQRASALFGEVERRYTELAALGRTLSPRPRVLLGAPYQGVWWVPGGRSFPAQMIRDAGGEYLFADHGRRGGVPLDLESALERALTADVWLHPSDWRSLGDGRRREPRFAHLPVLERGAVWNNDLRRNPFGFSDWWETAVVRPDWALADLIGILHPDALPEHRLVFHRRLEDDP